MRTYVKYARVRGPQTGKAPQDAESLGMDAHSLLDRGRPTGRSLPEELEHSGAHRAVPRGPDGVQELSVRWNGEEFLVTEPGTRSS